MHDLDITVKILILDFFVNKTTHNSNKFMHLKNSQQIDYTYAAKV